MLVGLARAVAGLAMERAVEARGVVLAAEGEVVLVM